MAKPEVKESKVAEPKKEIKAEVPKPVMESNTMNIPPASEKDDLFVIARDLTSAVIPPKPSNKATKQDLSMIRLGA